MIILCIIIIFIFFMVPTIEFFVENKLETQSIIGEKLSFFLGVPEKLYNQSKDTCDRLTKKLYTYAEIINPNIDNDTNGSLHSTITKINQNHFDLLESLRHNNHNLYCILLSLSNIIVENNNNTSLSCNGESFVYIRINPSSKEAKVLLINLLLIYSYKKTFNPNTQMFTILSKYKNILGEDDINKLIISLQI